MNLVRALIDWWRRAYGNELRRQRHIVEEDARRLNGVVTWND